ncbi:T-cell surface antigen CD2 isoform X1 [Ranitomeya variabilis]|uniref:T-cell surface antigen CD2 isoform X1 n=2 Tax=Ranitomeya variabilis TaxID=490064 RepID=UPI0040561B03
MEAQGARRRFPWSGFILLLSGILEIRGAEIYTIPGLPLRLDVPKCPQMSDSDSIEWEDEVGRLGKWKKTPSYSLYCNATLCTMHPNGSLTLQKPKDTAKNYRVKVYDSEGRLKCNESLTRIVEEMLQTPVLTYNCTSAGASVYCATTARNTTNLTLSWGKISQTTGEKSIARNIKELNDPVRCVVSNLACHTAETVTVHCTVWDLYLIVSVAGGGAALIIFIALVVYSVKYKPWRSRSQTEEDVETNRRQANAVQRQLLPPAGQTGPLCIQGDGTDHGLVQKPPTPHRPGEPTPGGRKGKRTRSHRLPPPPAPGKTATTCDTPAPAQSRPALPGNHPREQAPRLQPRTKSKPPRQSRKSRL